MRAKLLLVSIFATPSKTNLTPLLLLLVLVLGIQSNAQTNVYHPFPDTNAVWNTSYRFKDNLECDAHRSRSYIQKGDTTINNIHYNKLYLNEQAWIQPIIQLGCSLYTYPGTITSGIFKGGLRNDVPNKKVYYYDPSQKKECLLYNFALKVNDTIWNCGNGIGGYQYVVVTSIDSILIGSKYHKKFNHSGSLTQKPSIVEGVGSLTGLLEPRSFFEDGGELDCFSVLNQPLYYYNSASNCGVVGVSEPLSLNSFEIYPNPSKGTFTIESSAKISLIEVLNMLGEKIFSVSSNHKQETINLSPHPDGIYFLKLKTEQGSISKKIIIQH